MSPHPPVRARPQAVWRGGGATAVDPADARVLPYRPDWYAKLGARALGDPALKAVAFRHPACAVALLMSDFAGTRRILEPALVGSGEAAYHALSWAEGIGGDAASLSASLRPTLIRDGYWGFRHARRTGDAALLGEIEAWCGDERGRYAAAAALHLMRHPRESVLPYRELIASHPFYAYLALPRLHPRGLSIAAADIGSDPKWAWHFALSRFTADPNGFAAAILRDPGWALEYAAARGELKTGVDRRRWALRIEAAAPDHPLAGAVKAALGTRVAQPAALVAGNAVEARTLDALGRHKNKAVWRPSIEQLESDRFRQIVGSPRFTDRGYPRGTVVDSEEGGLAEIKSGATKLGASYQLRLQAFRAQAESQPLKIYTNRPLAEPFSHWLGPLGIKVEPLPEP